MVNIIKSEYAETQIVKATKELEVAKSIAISPQCTKLLAYQAYYRFKKYYFTLIMPPELWDIANIFRE